MIANLYTRYCDAKDDRGDECTEDDDKFSVFPTFGFFIMVAWVSVSYITNSYMITYAKCRSYMHSCTCLWR